MWGGHSCPPPLGTEALTPVTDVTVVVTQGGVSLRGSVETIYKGMNAFGVGKRLRIIVLAMFRVLAGISIFCLFALAQQPTSAWQEEVRRCAAAQDWTAAMSIVDREIARAPRDMDIRAWRARVLLWSGKVAEAEHEYHDLKSCRGARPEARRSPCCTRACAAGSRQPERSEAGISPGVGIGSDQ